MVIMNVNSGVSPMSSRRDFFSVSRLMSPATKANVGESDTVVVKRGSIGTSPRNTVSSSNPLQDDGVVVHRGPTKSVKRIRRASTGTDGRDKTPVPGRDRLSQTNQGRSVRRVSTGDSYLKKSTATTASSPIRGSKSPRRGSVSSRRGSLLGSSRRGSVATTSTRSSAISYDSILAGLPHPPLGDSIATLDWDDEPNDAQHPKAGNNNAIRGVEGSKRTLVAMDENLFSLERSSSSKSLNGKSSALARGEVVTGMPLPEQTVERLDQNEFDDLKIRSAKVGMSNALPVTGGSETVILKPDADARAIVVQTVNGEILATLETSPDRTRRLLWDANGNLCAIVIKSVVRGQNKFKISCEKPMNVDHRRSHGIGYYTWANVKNSNGFGVKFSMTCKSEPESKFTTESFAPSLLNWGKSPRGYIIKKDDVACGRLTYLGGARGLVLGKGIDLCMMICYAAIIDEMVENRLR